MVSNTSSNKLSAIITNLLGLVLVP